VRDERALARISIANPKATAHEIQSSAGPVVEDVSLRTIQRGLNNRDRRAYRPTFGPYLTPERMRNRLLWAREHKDWSINDWSKVRCNEKKKFYFHEIHNKYFLNYSFSQVVFSDETYLEEGPRQSSFVRRGVKETIRKEHTVARTSYPKKILIWACISTHGPGPIRLLETTMNAARYLDVLQNDLLPQIASWYPNNNFIFQQDNAPCHKALCVRRFFIDHDINVLDWPPYSPDLSPIENMWTILKRRLRRFDCTTKQELVARVNDIWFNDPDIKDICGHLINSMGRRMLSCITSKGAATKY
jgi:hypothetical protein